MTCMDTQRLIMPYINNELELEELEKFIRHVKSCPDCMEELEVYYVLLTSMQQLDEDKELSEDYHKDLLNLIKKSEEYIAYKRKVHNQKRVTLFTLLALIVFASSFQLGEFVVEDVLKRLTESNFRPDNIEIIAEEDMPVEITDQLFNVYLYLKKQDLEDANNMYEYYGNTIWNNTIIQTEFGSHTKIPKWTVFHY